MRRKGAKINFGMCAFLFLNPNSLEPDIVMAVNCTHTLICKFYRSVKVLTFLRIIFCFCFFVIARFFKGLKYFSERACGIHWRKCLFPKSKQIELKLDFLNKICFTLSSTVLLSNVPNPFSEIRNPSSILKSKTVSVLLPALPFPPSPPVPAGPS